MKNEGGESGIIGTRKIRHVIGEREWGEWTDLAISTRLLLHINDVTGPGGVQFFL